LAAGRPEAFEPDLAASLNNLSLRLSDMGRREEALGAIVGAVEIRRRLAAAVPKRFEPELAQSLSNFSILLNDLGRHEEAAEVAQEAAEILARHP
jgi:tetratricopeptide (TPR) repeat protein